MRCSVQQEENTEPRILGKNKGDSAYSCDLLVKNNTDFFSVIL
jgi:hypothetical protein